MGEATFVPARPEHAFVLATTMRPKDVAELAVCGLTPLDGLLQSLRVSSAAWALLYDDVVGALFGVELNPALGGPTGFWFLTGHAFAEHPLAFVRTSKRILKALLEVHGELANVIDARHDDAQRFAVMMGAQLYPAVPYGPNAAPFVPFLIRRH